MLKCSNTAATFAYLVSVLSQDASKIAESEMKINIYVSFKTLYKLCCVPGKKYLNIDKYKYYVNHYTNINFICFSCTQQLCASAFFVSI